MKASKVVFLVFLIILCLCVVNTQPVKAAETTENTWTTKTPIPEATHGVRAAAVNGKIYVMGDSINYEYDPATNNWTAKAPMPTPRNWFGIAAYQNKIYAIGGRVELSHFSANEVYDTSTNTWETKKPMPANISDVDANVVDGKIYMIGGSVNYVYNIAEDSWVNRTMPYPVLADTSTVFNNRIYIIKSGQIQIYDPRTDSWRLGAPIPTAVGNTAAVATTGVMALKRIYVIGGSGLGKGMNSLEGTGLTQVYNPLENTWTQGASMQTARLGLTAAVINDQIYAIAGSALAVFSPPLKVNQQYTPFGYGTPDLSYDDTPPEITLTSPENKTYTVSNVSLTFAVNEPTLWIGYSVDRQANVTIVGNTTLMGLSDGKHSLTVYAEDTSGNTGSSEKFYFTVDTSSPTVSILSPQNKTYTTADIPLTFTVNETASWIGYSLDGQANVTITGNTTLNGLSNGLHNLTVYATDRFGNTGASETITFSVTEPFPTTWMVAAIASVAIVSAGLLFYFKKRNRGRKS